MLDSNAISGSAFSLWQVIIGRVVAGVGSSGIVGLVSIVITGGCPYIA